MAGVAYGVRFVLHRRETQKSESERHYEMEMPYIEEPLIMLLTSLKCFRSIRYLAERKLMLGPKNVNRPSSADNQEAQKIKKNV